MKRTIKDVARAAGVSVATASMALNDREGVSEKTRHRVKQVAGELHYIPDYMARGLVTQDSNCIGLMVPEIQNPFYSAVVDVLSRLAGQKDFTLLLGISGSKPQQERRYLEMFLARRVMGVIIVPMLTDRPDVQYLDMLRRAEVPLVFLTDTYAGASEPVVMCDFAQGQYEATRMLLDKGLKDLFYVTVDMQTNFVTRRMEGFQRALAQADLPFNESRVVRLKDPSYIAAYRAADEILTDLPQAIVCINDIMTIGLMKKLSERGVQVPRDVWAVGFDDVQVAALVTPQLTTVHQPVTQMCEKTFELLEKKIAAGDGQGAVGREEIILARPRLVERESTR